MPNETENTNPLETLVGEGKKYSSAEELAKAYLHASNHIETLITEKRNVEEQLSERASIAELLAPLSQPKPVEPQPEPTPVAAVPAEVDKQAVAQVVQELILESQQKQNQKSVTEAVLAAFENSAEKASAFVRERALTLGLSADDLDKLSKQSPTAALNLLGLNQPSPNVQKNNTPIRPNSAVNTGALSVGQQANQGLRTDSYYKELYKTDPRLANDPAIVLQRHNDFVKAKEQGVNFFG